MGRPELHDAATGGASHRRLPYRPEIDGLRAIAVLGVVLFHFGADWLPGGFVGVDVFYVISGYLISKTIFAEIDAARFSIGAFYERRARRILPALLVVTALTAIPAWFFLYPGELADFARSVVASLTFTANIFFYATTGYFGPTADEIPLLHYWSLGVEEQFYLLFPLVVLLAHRALPRSRALVLGALLGVSLAASALMLQRDPSAAFYLLPFRAFELLIGSLLAIRGVPRPAAGALAGAATGVGIALVIGSMLLISEGTPFPGLAALAPCLGAALVLWGADSAQGWPASLLALRPVVFIGLISYSLYLVHWPIAVFAPDAIAGLDGLPMLVGGTALSVGLAWLSYRLVERPVRSNRRLFTRPVIAWGGVVGTVVLVAVAGVTIARQGFPEWLGPRANEMLAYLSSYDYRPAFREGTCFLRPEQAASEIDLDACYPEGTDVVLFGNSYVAQLYAGLEPLFAERGKKLGLLAGSACPMLRGVEMDQRPNCPALFDLSRQAVLDDPPETVILSGDLLVNETNFARVDELIAELDALGVKVVVLGPVPYYVDRVPTILAERIRRGDPNLLSGTDMRPGTQEADALLAQHFVGSVVTYVSFLGAGCPDGQCPLGDGRVPYNWDVVHVTQWGSDYYAARLIDRLITP